MKTATFPAVRTAPALRELAETVLAPGETLSSFIEDSLKRNVALRLSDSDFIERGLQARQQAKESGRYVSVEQTMVRLRALHAATRDTALAQ